MNDCVRSALWRLFDELSGQVNDVRRPPDIGRRSQFTTGWNDRLRGRVYGDETLERLTWRNLGYRAAGVTGGCLEANPAEAYEYLAEGYDSGELRLPGRRWEPVSREDELLQRYWHRHGGEMHTEVAVAGRWGPWPGRGAIRRIDGVRFATPERNVIYLPGDGSIRQFVTSDDIDIEVIEVKRSLNRLVMGQTSAGKVLLCERYGFARSRVEEVVVCGEGDVALEWACRELGIRVEVV